VHRLVVMTGRIQPVAFRRVGAVAAGAVVPGPVSEAVVKHAPAYSSGQGNPVARVPIRPRTGSAHAMSSVLTALDAVIDWFGRSAATDPIALAGALRSVTDPPAEAAVEVLSRVAGSPAVDRMRAALERDESAADALAEGVAAADPDVDPAAASAARWACPLLGAALGLLPRAWATRLGPLPDGGVTAADPTVDDPGPHDAPDPVAGPPAGTTLDPLGGGVPAARTPARPAGRRPAVEPGPGPGRAQGVLPRARRPVTQVPPTMSARQRASRRTTGSSASSPPPARSSSTVRSSAAT
jgi:hypothetical protein